MLRGRRAGIAAALAIAAAAAVTAGCGGGSTSSALQLDPVAAAATKTQNAGAARVRLNMAISARDRRLGMHGAGVIDGTSAEMSFKLGSMARAGLAPAARARQRQGDRARAGRRLRHLLKLPSSRPSCPAGSMAEARPHEARQVGRARPGAADVRQPVPAERPARDARGRGSRRCRSSARRPSTASRRRTTA